MKNKKGFTLIELLAVIVILAIIALIAIPIVLNMIESARKAAARDTAYGYIDAIEYNNGFADMEVAGYTRITGDDIDISDISVKLKGKAPDSGEITVDNKGKVTDASLCIGKYKVEYNGKEVTNVEKSSDCSGTKKLKFKIGDIVYFDPVKYEFCNEAYSTCYEWIVISRKNNTYEFFMLDDVSSMLWYQTSSTSNPVDIIKTYVTDWSNKLTVDSSHDVTVDADWKLEFSSTKARMLDKSEFASFPAEMKTIISNKCTRDTEANARAWRHCSIMNNAENTFAIINSYPEIDYVANTIPYVAKSCTWDNYIKPVIKVDITDGVGNTSNLDYKKYNVGDLVYFDPVSNNKCDSTSFNATNVANGTSTCYKWRVITTADTVYMPNVVIQLDHEIALSKWASSSTSSPATVLTSLASATSGWNNVSNLNFEYDTSAAQYNYGKLTCTNGSCKISGNNSNIATNVKARIITGEELKRIIAISNTPKNSRSNLWNISSTSNDYYYFSNKSMIIGTNQSASGNGSTALSWLIENTASNSSSGATDNAYGSNVGGYWTLSPVADYNGSVWNLTSDGEFDSVNINRTSYGLRPVITIEKSKLN